MTVEDRFAADLEEYRRAAHRALDAEIERIGERGLSAAPSPEDLVAFGALARSTGHELAEAVGPVYDARAVGRFTGLRRQQLADRRRRGTILALRTSDGAWVYPTFQFTANGTIHPPIRTLLDVFRGRGNDPWTVAAWMNTPKSDLNGQAPSDAAADQDRVLQLAQRAAARWAP